MDIQAIKQHILDGGMISREQAKELYLSADLAKLSLAANEIKTRLCGNGFDLCNIISAKVGGCSEDCKFCAQSAKHKTNIEVTGLIDADAAIEQGIGNYVRGVGKFSLVASGRRVSGAEFDKVCRIYEVVRDAAIAAKKKHNLTNDLQLCASLGLLDSNQLQALKAVGVSRYHCNVETSRRFFPNICTTHTYDDKLITIKAAIAVGMDVCSGGIMGMGESVDDRLDMAFELRELGVESIPINFLSPIEGTPLYGAETVSEGDAKRIIAVYRFVLPTAQLRLAGGRGLYRDGGHSLVSSGINSAITGDLLTTPGVSVDKDLELTR